MYTSTIYYIENIQQEIRQVFCFYFLYCGDKKFMSSILPSILVPLVGLVFPAVAMASMFLYIEKEQIN